MGFELHTITTIHRRRSTISNKLVPLAKDDLLQALNIALQTRLGAAAINFADNNRGWFITEKDERFHVRNLQGAVATFALKELPGCCGVLVSFYSEVAENYRKQGLGTLLNGVRMDAARRAGYGLLLATVLQSNQIEKALLKDNGWVLTREFRNPKTQNIVEVYQVNL